MRIGVIGCGGRMGRANLKELLRTDGVEVVGGTDRAASGVIGEDLGVLAGGDPIGIAVSADPRPLLVQAHAVIEFSTPEASVAHAALCAEASCAHVIGTTGMGAEHIARLREHARQAPIVWSGNMSQGVNLLLALVEQVARSLGQSFDIEVVEMHHRHKVDAPSGTALMLGEAAARGRGVELSAVAARGRDGHTGARRAGDIGFAALRGGDVVGDHTVVFAGDGERIELTHKASSREIYAKGAVRAALWAAAQPAGLYGMADVLGMRSAGPGGSQGN